MGNGSVQFQAEKLNSLPPGSRIGFLKIYHYLSFTISLIFLVTGILILSGLFFNTGYFRNSETLRYSFGGLLVVYGIFRGVNTFYKIKNVRNSADEE
jgi:hypothetical protein